jgi:hypothetical protein
MYWDLNLCMKYDGKVLVPFHYYCKPQPQLIPPPSPRSFPFFHLPIDIQLIVYEHCDPPTLFQLMRTCSRSRHAATKLFWNSTFADHWYHCSDYWLSEARNSRYLFASHCPEFALRITNIELDVGRIEGRFRDDDEDDEDDQDPEKPFRASTITKARTFWERVGRVFPSAKRIVLTGCEPREPNPFASSDERYACIETVVAYAPAHVKVYIAFVADSYYERDRPPRNTLWQAPDRSQSVWRILNSDWNPTRVLLPDRKWTVSPLGDFQAFIQQNRSAMLEMRGIEWLKIESYARYAVQDIIHCPYLDCPLAFREKDLWRQHLSASRHERFEIRRQSEGHPMEQLFCYKHTPDIEKAAIEARQQRLDAQCLEAVRIAQRVGYGWGPPRSQQRRFFEQEFKAQLPKESLSTPDEPAPGMTSPADQYLGNLLVFFLRGHIYHGDCTGNEEGHICYES